MCGFIKSCNIGLKYYDWNTCTEEYATTNDATTNDVTTNDATPNDVTTNEC